jgi:hypothetical protein
VLEALQGRRPGDFAVGFGDLDLDLYWGIMGEVQKGFMEGGNLAG